MAFAQALGASVQFENTKADPIARLDKTLTRVDTADVSPSSHELDDLKWGRRLNGPRNDSTVDSVCPTPGSPTPRELEKSRPTTPHPDHAVHALVQSATNPPRNKWRLASSGIFFLLLGLQDAVTGALIPYIEADYNITYSVVSLIFITYAIGFLSVAPVVHALDSKMGRSWFHVLTVASMSIGYVMLIPAPPYPVVVVAFWFLGFGAGGNLATLNSWTVNLLHGTLILSFMQALYGVGGIVAPLLATALVTNGISWSYFYSISLALSVTALVTMGWAFRHFEEHTSQQLLTALQRTASRQAAECNGPTKVELFKKSLKNRTTILGATFIFFYQGSEVAISGWVISYLIHYRDGDPAHVGKVTSGFWGGITLGRMVLTPICRRLGLRYSVAGLILCAAAMQALVWAVPSIITDAVAESIVGFALGPAYPCAVAVFFTTWPSNIQMSSLALVSSMGSSGGALVPFVTGIMAQSLTTVVLHPIAIFSFTMMLGSWTLLPKVSKRSE